MPQTDPFLLLPAFLKRLADPAIKTVMLCGCGGGFDFVHSLTLYPQLRQLGKSIVIGSYSFGNPERISDDTEVVFYRECLEHIYQRQGFRSILAGVIVSAVEGRFGTEPPSPLVPGYVENGELFLWPLMAVLWAFDIDAVAERSLISHWIRACQTVHDCYEAVITGRAGLESGLRDVEDFPRHEEMRF